MDAKAQTMYAALKDLDLTTSVLLQAVEAQDGDKAHEAVSVLLAQGLDYFGVTHPVMQQFVPVWRAIKDHIYASRLAKARDQTRIWQRQLNEVITILEKS